MSTNNNERLKLEGLLYEYKDIKVEIKELELMIDYENIQAVGYDDMPKSPNVNTSSSVESGLDRIEKLRNKKMYLICRQKRIENMLSLLNERDRSIVEMYYFNDYSLRDIAFKLDLNDNYLSRRKAYILNKLVPFAVRHKLVI
jgi:DNA-directed RNA polymerase specialized sigma subunit|nr:MAG TPA: Sigma70 [Caudoviricetes sp.]